MGLKWTPWGLDGKRQPVLHLKGPYFKLGGVKNILISDAA